MGSCSHGRIRAREAIAEARDALPALIPDEVAEGAAELLDSLWCAAIRHDVDPDELAGVASLPDACTRVFMLRARWTRTG
ncbi:MAG: hypothetical protein ACRDPT_12305 [Streptomycetales bacterium]